MTEVYQQAGAYFIVRVFLGILFLFQGYDKIFKIGIAGVIQEFDAPLEMHSMKKGIIKAATYYTSYAEFLGGGLLILGIFNPIISYMLGLDILMAGFAFSLIRPMWDMQFVFPRLALLIGLMLMPASWDVFSLNQFLK